MKFDINAARSAGYSDDEIADYLATENKFDLSGALKSGYSASEVIDFLTAPKGGKQDLPADVEPSEGRSADFAATDPRRVDRKPSAGSNSITADQYRAEVEQRRQNPPARSMSDAAKDAGITLLKGAIGLPESVVGLLDIPAQGRIGKFLEEQGYRPREAKEILDSYLSEAQQVANRKVQSAEGFVPTVKAALENPSTIVTAAGESLPQMIGGAGAARQILKAAPKVAPYIAGAIGEGLLGAGSAASQIRGQTEDGLLTGKQAASALASGAGTAIFGAVGGRVASKLGFDDIDTMLASGSSKGASKSVGDFAKRVAAAGVSEGVFEEMPQSAQEQIWQNYAMDKPLLEGVGNAAGMGLVTGAAMGMAGGGAGALLRPATREAEVARAIDQEIANTEFSVPASEVAVDLLNPGSYDQRLISPTETARPAQPMNFTPEGSPSADAGLVPIVVPVPTAQETNNVSTAGVAGTPAAVGGIAGSNQLGGGVDLSGSGLAGAGTVDRAGAGAVAGNAGPDVAAGGAAGQQAASVGLPRPLARSTDADLLARTEATVAAQQNNNAVVQPTEQWFGRKGDGYVTQQDAQQALPGRQRMFPQLDWKIEQMPNSKFRLAGYEQASTETSTASTAGRGLPAAGSASPTMEATGVTTVNQETTLGNQAPQAVQAEAQGQEAPAASPRAAAATTADAGLGARTPDQSASIRLSAQQALDTWSSRSGSTAPQLGTPDADAEATVNVLGSLFGQATGIGNKVVAYKEEGGDNGFSYGGYAFINTAADTDVTAPRTTLHEIKHVAERMAKIDTQNGLTNTPAQKFVQQIDSIFDDMTDEGKRAYVEKFLHKDELDKITDPAEREAKIQEYLNSDLLRSEMTADFLGNRATDRAFLVDLAKQDPKGFEGFVKKWLDVIDNLISKLRGSARQDKLESAKVDQYVRDLNKAKMVARDALVAFRKGNLGETQAATPQDQLKAQITEKGAQPVMSQRSDGASVDAVDPKPATAADERKAERYERENGILPYTSAGQIEVPVDTLVGPLFSIKQEGKYGNHPLFDIPVNKNGTVTLYYPATNEEARRVAKDKSLRAVAGSNRIYLTNESSGAKVMNNRGNIEQDLEGANVLVQVDPSLLQLDMEHADGRKDFFIPIAEGQEFFKKMRMTRLFTQNAPRTKALTKDTKLTDLERRISDGVAKYVSLTKAEQRIRLKEAKTLLKREHNVTTLLGVNGKLEKTNTGGYGLNNYEGKDVKSMGLGLASAQKINENNLSTCPKSAICESLCLGETSGQNLLYGGEGDFKSGPRLSQYLKTEAMVVHPEEFAVVLHSEIAKLARDAKKEDYQATVRLNVTSDFRPQTFAGIINAFPDVMFYDYTKLPSKSISDNHHLTYSSTGASQVVNGKTIVNPESNWNKMVEVMRRGDNVAMAFSDKNTMPKYVVDEKSGERFQVWNGDNYDARFLDPKPGDQANEFGKGMIIGLTNKDRTGKPEQAAEKNRGFFIDYNPERDGDTVVIKNQDMLASGVKFVPIRAVAATAPAQETAEAPSFSARATPTFYSQLERVVEGVPAKLATQPAKQWALWLDSNAPKLGVKKDEIEWSGIKDYLTLRGNDKVTKADLVAYLNESGVKVDEVQSPVNTSIGTSDFTRYVLPGGNNYREVLITLPPKDTRTPEQREFAALERKMREEDGLFPEDNRRMFELGEMLGRAGRDAALYGVSDGVYMSSHWEESNILAHIRVVDRTDADGSKVLFVEEVQSDWGQEGREKGFSDARAKTPSSLPSNMEVVEDTFARNPAFKYYVRNNDTGLHSGWSGPTPEEAVNTWLAAQNRAAERQYAEKNVGKIPAAPFVTKTEGWLNLALKRIAMMAVEEGYDKVAFVNGQQSADRYSLEKQVTKIEYASRDSNPAPDRALTVYGMQGEELISKNVTEEELPDMIGKEVADRLLQAEPKSLGGRAKFHVISGIDLKVGGEGMKTFYDQIVPQALNKLLPKLGGEKLGAVSIPLEKVYSDGPEYDYASAAPVGEDGGPYIVLDRDGNEVARFDTSAEAATETDRLNASTASVSTQPGFDVTDKMRETVGEGLPMFSRRAAPDTPAFKRWFGDSKVVDAKGEPLVVYHGTNADFSEFDLDLAIHFERDKGKAFFYSAPQAASDYAEGLSDYKGGNANVMPVYLAIRKPHIIEVEGFPSEEWDMAGGRFEREAPLGTDGFIVNGTDYDGNPETMYVVTKPEQIKSATGNNGEFDATNPDIRKSSRTVKRQKLVGMKFDMESSSRIDQARIKLQDDTLRMKRVIDAVKAKGGKVTEAQNFYDANTLMPGRVQAAIDDFKNDVVKPLLDKAAEYKIDLDELAMYSYAKHAKERNAYIASINKRMPDGGSGMTNDEADNIIQMVDLAGDKDKFEELHQMLMGITSATRQIMLTEGLITEEEFNQLEGAYENYIPLRGFEDFDIDTGVARPGIGRGVNIRGAETVRAMGRKTKAGDLIENVIRDYERVIMRVERNDVGKVLLDFVLSNPDPDLWGVDVERNKPAFNKGTGTVQYTKSIEKGEDTIGVKVGGQQIYIKLADKELTRALRQAWKDETSGLERATLAMTGWWNNWMRAVLTKYNPAFAAINIPRDALWSGTAAALDDLGAKGLGLYLKNYGKALMASSRQELGVSGTTNAIFGNPQVDRMFQEFRASGGITGGFYMRSLEDINKDLRNELLLSGASARNPFEAVKSLPPFKLAKLTLRVLEFLGAASENATRFALYMTSREMGKSTTQSALLAKNGTTNFNRKGEWGGALNNLYLFFNAGVQGTAQLVKVLKNPKVQGAMAGVTGVSMMLALYGASAGGEDDDGEAYWDKIPSYVKERNLVIMLPPGGPLASGIERVGKRGRYITIPAQYGFNIFPNLGYVMADVLRNQQDKRRGMTPAKAALHMTSVVFGSVNPFGGSVDVTDGVQVLLAVAPTLLDLPVQLINERNSFGSPASPAKSPFDKRPDSERMFTSQQGTLPAKIAKALNELGGGNEAKAGSVMGVETSVTPGTIDTLIRTTTGGLGAFVEQVGTTVTAMSGKDDVKANKLPVLNRFYGEVDESANIRTAAERMAQIRKLSDEVKAQQKVGLNPELTKDEERLMALAGMQETYQKAQAQMRKAELEIIKDPKLTEAEKKVQRQQIQVSRDKLATEMNREYLKTVK